MAKAEAGLSEAIERLAHQYPKLAAKREGAELFGAPRLNAFMLFQPNEVRLSRIIADLFDPSGSHGQDILFLNALLQSLSLPPVGVIDPVSVRREMLTKAGRQIDLVIELPDYIIGIENKPWAGQQPNQLADYFEALNGWSRSRRPVLVFLSNKEPETAKEDVRIVRFHSDDGVEPSLNKIIAECRDRAQALRTRIHLDELLAYLAVEFGEAPMRDNSDTPYVEAVEAEFSRGLEGRRALAMTMLAGPYLHQKILTEISEYIMSEVRKSFQDIEEEYDEWSLFEALEDKNDWWGIRRPDWPENCAVAMSAGDRNFSKVYFGVRAPDGKRREIAESDACALRKAVEAGAANVEGGNSSAWWPWWKHVVPRDWSSSQLGSMILQSPTGKLTDHPEVKALTFRMVALVAAVDKALE